MGIRLRLAGLKSFCSCGQVHCRLANHTGEVAQPWAVIGVVAALVEVHWAAQLQGGVVALPIGRKPFFEAQQSAEGVAAAPQRCRSQQAPAAAIAIRKRVDGDKAMAEQGGPDQGRHHLTGMPPLAELLHQRAHILWPGRGVINPATDGVHNRHFIVAIGRSLSPATPPPHDHHGMQFLNPGLAKGAAALGPFLHTVEGTPVVANLLFGLASLAISGCNRHAHGLVIERVAFDASAATGAALIGRVAQPQAFICWQWQQPHPRPGISNDAEVVNQRIAVVVMGSPWRRE